jgi:endonuclease/exonuclease/phosphatase family metal-dependent hydrolase
MRARRLSFWVATAVVLVPAALLTLVRATEPAQGWLIRAESFTPVAIPLYAAALLLGLGALATRRSRRGRGRARTPFLLLALLAVAGLGVHGMWFSAQVVGPNPPAAAGAEPLTVMTANLYRGRADGIDLVRIASEEGVDVLAVHEVTTRTVAAMERAGVAALLPHRIGDAPGGDGVDGTMVFSRLPLGEPAPLSTQHDGWAVAVGDLSLLAVHVIGPTDPAQWRDDHEAVLDAADAADADLVVGDFNATLDHRPMRLLGERGWRSAAELTNEGWQPTWPVIGWLGMPMPALMQIDHVLVGPSLAAMSTQTVAVPGTDHRAVIAGVARK